MANLVIDIGNTYIKIAVFNDDEPLEVQSYTQVDQTIINHFLKQHQPEKAIISSVKPVDENWEQDLRKHTELIKFNPAMATSVKNHYRTPQTLGADRLAAVAGAFAIYPGKANMVIDAGTCITYDWVDAAGNYFGGSISPGLQMRYKALNYYTAVLPLVEPEKNFTAAFGNDTTTAIQSGVQNGIRFEMLGFMERYFKRQQPMNIVLSGGDAIFFDTLLKNSIFAPHIKIEPYLVLKGLNAVIQQHND